MIGFLFDEIDLQHIEENGVELDNLRVIILSIYLFEGGLDLLIGIGDCLASILLPSCDHFFDFILHICAFLSAKKLLQQC